MAAAVADNQLVEQSIRAYCNSAMPTGSSCCEQKLHLLCKFLDAHATLAHPGYVLVLVHPWPQQVSNCRSDYIRSLVCGTYHTL